MNSPVSRPARGWAAFALSLALHGGLFLGLTCFRGRATEGTAPADGPPVVHLIEEETPDADVTGFLVPCTGQPGPPARAAQPGAGVGPREVAVTHPAEDIVPHIRPSALS